MRSNSGRVAQVLLGGPVVLAGQVAVGGFVEQIAPAHAVDLVQAGHAALRADRAVAHVGVAQHLVDGVLDVRAVGVAVDHHAGTALAAQQLVQRQAGGLGLQVPQRGVDGGDGGHGDRAATPVGTLVQVLPDILDLVRVAADQAGDDVFGQIGRHRQLAAVQGGVADAGQALVGLDLQRHEIAAGRANDHACVRNFHLGFRVDG